MRFLTVIIIVILITSCSNKKTNYKSHIISSKSGNPIELWKQIDSSDIVDIHVDTLRILRNEIYARHGYSFKSNDLKAYFSQFDWYRSINNNDQIINQLTLIEKRNIDLIKSIEIDKNEPVDWDNETLEFLNLVPNLNVPLKFNCSNGFEGPRVDEVDEIVKNNIPEGAHIVGKLYHDKREAAIIFGFVGDIFYPLVSIINHQGIEVGRIPIFESNQCGYDAGFTAKTDGVITEDFEIKSKTTTITYDTEIEEPIYDTVVDEKVRKIKY